MDSFYPESYEASRARFLRDVEPLRLKWTSAHPGTHQLKDFPDLSVDWFWAEPTKMDKLIIVSTGQHGIEGYVGSAMLKVFIDEFAQRIHSENTGLLLVHAINPWGMKHGRKVNENGVDLNRNFILNGKFDKAVNPDFPKLRNFLAPDYPARNFGTENLFFLGRTIKALLTKGTASITNAALLGQYIDPNAMYFGGERHEEETKVIMQLFQEALEKYQNVIHLDQHSGYGPRYQMSITLVPPEARSSAELSTQFAYPLVLKGDSTEFYETHGDMAACLYELRNAEFPNRHVFATAFEFGTYGESLPKRIQSLRTMIFESQLYWHGSAKKATEEKIRHEFQELYFPAETRWREKALADCRQAFTGILAAYGVT